MHVLLVKSSSLGDLVHTFPAVTDAASAIPGIRFDWVVEEAFAEVPAWHPAVDRVIPIALRRWRRDWRKAFAGGEVQSFYRALRERAYDLVIDAQGLLLKSAVVARLARGPAAGFDRRSAREPRSSLCYEQRYSVSREQHAIDRNRHLFASALDYLSRPEGIDYGLRSQPAEQFSVLPYVVFLPNTTWESKHWPEAYWAELTALTIDSGLGALIPWSSPDDRLRAERILKMGGGGALLPRMGLTALAKTMSAANGIVGVDSGLSHVAAALGVPTVVVYGPTSTRLTGARGSRAAAKTAVFDCAPCMRRHCVYPGESRIRPACFEQLGPQQIWRSLNELWVRETTDLPTDDTRPGSKV